MTEVRLATEPEQVATAYAIRSKVFVGEQGVPAELELDELDATADHFLAYDDTGWPVGAGRLVIEPPGFVGAPGSTRPVGHLGRLAVLGVARGSGLGLALVQAIERRAVERGLQTVTLSAQTHAIAFYERLGYAAHGHEFDDAGLPHRWMTRSLR